MMGKEEARGELGLSAEADQKDLEDAYEQQCFPVRDYLLKHPVVPQVVEKRLYRLLPFHEAYQVLAGEENCKPEVEMIRVQSREEAEKILESGSLLQLLRNYEQGMMHSKLPLANAFGLPGIAKAAVDMVRIQNAYHRLYHDFFQQTFPVLYEAMENGQVQDVDPEVKIMKQVDSGELISILKEHNTLGEVEEEAFAGALPEVLKGEGAARLAPLFTEAVRIDKLFRLNQ